uniref:Chloride channel protein n=2 Tax=Parascaris univalens TaxID=6257 RepID=A0A914ZR78_PARUN
MELLRKVSTSFKREGENKDENDEPDLEAALTSLYGIGCVMADIKRSLLDVSPVSKGEEEDESCEEETSSSETFTEFWKRHTRNVLHFLVEDWCLSAMLGIITAVLSVGMDVAIEKLQHLHVALYVVCRRYSEYLALFQWISHVTFLTFVATLGCLLISRQAVGSGIPEVKVIMHGFKMKNYLTFRTLIAKMFGLTLAIGSGLPIGKEGPFVHMGAIVATLLSKLTKACQYSAFFSNEGREIEMLSSGCAVGIACTFSAPVGAVLYAIESTSKYFAVKNYWRGFLAATCSAIIFRFANFFVTAEQSGTITAFYQTSFPTESFLVEELPVFALLGLLGGLLGAMFIFTHRHITLFRERNRLYKVLFCKNFFTFTIFMAAVVGILTYPQGFGRYIAGKLTFRETMADFFNNCTFYALNQSAHSCDSRLLEHWTGGSDGGVSIFLSLACYLATYFLLVAICISINVPAGVFVPSFVIGAAGGRLMGETMSYLFPEGLRGAGGPPVYPGLYAVVGAAAYTGAVTHTLSVAVIICELTGQLTPILPVLIAMLVGNAVCKFLQPSIYESIIRIKKYPYLPDLPPSRISVHTVKVEQVMIRDVVYITKSTTYRELREILRFAPHLKSFPVVTDRKNKILLGSVAKKYLMALMRRHLLADQLDRVARRTPSDLFNTLKKSSMRLSRRTRRPGGNDVAKLGPLKEKEELLDDRSISGNT